MEFRPGTVLRSDLSRFLAMVLVLAVVALIGLAAACDGSASAPTGPSTGRLSPGDRPGRCLTESRVPDEGELLQGESRDC